MGRHRSATSKRAARLQDLAEHERAMLGRVGARITTLRRQGEHLSIAELAQAAGLHPSYLGEVERGQANVSVLSLLRVAAALQVPLAALLGEEPLPATGEGGHVAP